MSESISRTGPAKVDGSGVTQPVSATALPLPTGASTEATLAAIKAKTDNLDVATSTRTKPADTQLVDGSAHTQPVSGTFWQTTQPVSAAALPLPTGAATENTLGKILTEGVDITGVSMPAGGQGGRGWLSAIYSALKGTLAVSGTFWQATQPTSVADGANVTIGTTTDTSSANTVVGLLKKIAGLFTFISTKLAVDISGGTGTVQNAQTAIATTAITNGLRISVACANYATATITFSHPSGTVGTVAGSFWGSDDGGTTFYALPALRISANPPVVVYATGTLAAGQMYLLNCAGLSHISWLNTTFTGSPTNWSMNATLSTVARDFPAYVSLLPASPTTAAIGAVTVPGGVVSSHGKTLQTVPIDLNLAAVGDNTIVAAVTAHRIKVVAWFIQNNAGGGGVTWKDGASTNLSGTIAATTLTDTFEQSTECPSFVLATTAGNALILNCGAADFVQGYVTYWADDTL